MTEVELYRTVTACREALREPLRQLHMAHREAIRIAGGDPEIVRLANEAELACERARVELEFSLAA